MSDLDTQIAQWRASLEPQVGSQSTDELEDHLRALVDSLAHTDLSEEERLLVAFERLGQPNKLASEFQKNGSPGLWRLRLLWLCVGLIPLHLLQQAIERLSMDVGFTMFYAGISPTIAALATMGVWMVALAQPLAAYYWIRNEKWPLGWQRSRRASLPFVIPAGILAALAVLLLYTPLLILKVVNPLQTQMAAQRPELNFTSINTEYTTALRWFGFAQIAYWIVFGVALAWLTSTRRTDVVQTAD